MGGLMNRRNKITIRFPNQILANGEQGEVANVKGTAAEKAIEKAQRTKAQLAAEYSVPTTSIVWCGDNRYIVVKDGKEIKIGWANDQR